MSKGFLKVHNIGGRKLVYRHTTVGGEDRARYVGPYKPKMKISKPKKPPRAKLPTKARKPQRTRPKPQEKRIKLKRKVVPMVVVKKRRPTFTKAPKDFALPTKMKLTGIQKSHFYALIRKHGLDYKTIDTRAILDPTLSYYENKRLLEEHLAKIRPIALRERSVSEIRAEMDKYRHYWIEFKRDLGVKI